MRNGGLRQPHTLLNIGRTESVFLIEGAATFFFERLQNAAASGVGNGVQQAIEMGNGHNYL